MSETDNVIIEIGYVRPLVFRTEPKKKKAFTLSVKLAMVAVSRKG